MALRTHNKNPYLIGGNPPGSVFAPVNYSDFVVQPNTQVISSPSITYAQGTNNYGAGTGNYITPTKGVDTAYSQGLGLTNQTSTVTKDATPYSGVIQYNTETGETKNVASSATETTATDPTTDITQYYGELRRQAIEQAEKDRLQANINAKGQYNEFINPYGVQAEQQARMGFAGGGYSEYLKGKAYEGMLNTQNQAQEQYSQAVQKAENLYNKNMISYQEGLKTEQESQATAKANLLNSLGTIENEQALTASLDALGITDATERQTIIDAWTKRKTENDAKEFSAKNVAMSTYISGESSDSAPKSRDDVYNYAIGIGLNNEQANEWASKWEVGEYYIDFDSFDSWNQKEQDDFFAPENFNRLSLQQQTDIQNRYSAKENPMALFGEDVLLSPDDAKSVLETVLNSNRYSQEFKDAAQKRYNQLYSVDAVVKAREFVGEDKVKDNASVIVPKSDGSYNLLDFGKFNDSGTGKGEQDKYLNAILDSTKDGAQNPIAEGQVVIVNYGRNEGEIDAFVYVGNGIFVKVSAADANINNLYIPKGYNKKTDGKNIAIVKDNTTN